MPVQTKYPILPDFAVPGMLAESNLDAAVIDGQYAAAGNIPFGSAVELVSGKLQVCQQTTNDLSKLYGVAVYQGMREQAYPPGSTAINAGYQAGDMVPVLRRGRIYGLWDGSTSGGFSSATAFTTVNIAHSSDGSHDQGQFNQASTSTAAGSENTTAGNGWITAANQATLPTNCVLLEVNLPA